MTVFVMTLVFMLLLVAAMAIGVLMGRKPIKGSCGGMSALGVDADCEICGGDREVCEERGDLGYEVGGK